MSPNSINSEAGIFGIIKTTLWALHKRNSPFPLKKNNNSGKKVNLLWELHELQNPEQEQQDQCHAKGKHHCAGSQAQPAQLLFAPHF